MSRTRHSRRFFSLLNPSSPLNRPVTSFGTCVSLTLFLAALAATGVGPTPGEGALRAEHAATGSPLSMLFGAMSAGTRGGQADLPSDVVHQPDIEAIADQVPPHAGDCSRAFFLSPSLVEHATQPSSGTIRAAGEWRVIREAPIELPRIGRRVFMPSQSEPL